MRKTILSLILSLSVIANFSARASGVDPIAIMYTGICMSSTIMVYLSVNNGQSIDLYKIEYLDKVQEEGMLFLSEGDEIERYHLLSQLIDDTKANLDVEIWENLSDEQLALLAIKESSKIKEKLIDTTVDNS